MTLATEAEILAPTAHREPKSGALVRLAAGIAGLVVLACATVGTVGTVVIVLIGMAIVAGVQGKRGRALTRAGHWVTACATMGVILLALIGASFAYVPPGTLKATQQSMDSSSAVAAKRPPPAWVQKLYPRYSQRQRAGANTKPSRRVVWASTILVVGVVVGFFGTLLGTLSWGAGMLIGLALWGRWPGRQGSNFDELTVDLHAATNRA